MGNVLFSIPGFESWSLQEIRSYMGEPYKIALTRTDDQPVVVTPHLPKYLVPSSDSFELLEYCLSVPEKIQAKLCDFGESFLWSNDTAMQIRELHTPSVYAAPEIMFQDYVGPGTDVWALAVLMHTILSGGHFLFDSVHGIQQEVLREMVLILGKLPEKWWNKWSEKSEYFDESGKFVGDNTRLPPVSGNLLKIFPNRMADDELSELRRIILRMVPYEIADRIPVAEVELWIEDSWSGSRVQQPPKLNSGS